MQQLLFMCMFVCVCVPSNSVDNGSGINLRVNRVLTKKKSITL